MTRRGGWGASSWWWAVWSMATLWRRFVRLLPPLPWPLPWPLSVCVSMCHVHPYMHHSSYAPSFLLQMTNLITTIDINKNTQRERMELISAYMRAHKFPRFLRQRVRRHYRNLWNARWVVHSFIHACMHAFIRSFMYSFVHAFINLIT